MKEMNIELSVKLMKYRNDKDFKDFVDKCCKTYNKTIEEILQTPITEQYYIYLMEKEKGINENQ